MAYAISSMHSQTFTRFSAYILNKTTVTNKYFFTIVEQHLGRSVGNSQIGGLP